ncbi:NAD(P)-binding protein [Morchella conica CCBAS932]|uniref:3beta-hydroxysteroid 3-dehydrogenase n=1 Tax=Morchella conica CCBAS932 TaxID=1392247 RepID=A0A3N4L6Y5_9PEZI|nr:NAD(P)-binding protein [Morchella conica CCBAS932]
MSDDTHFFALLTGSNSGLGLSIAHRILDEFLSTHPPTHHLTLILTTRSASKGAATLTTLTKHLVHNLPPTATSRITLTHYQVDLTNLLSITALAAALSRSYTKLDYVFLNAGMGAFTGIDWLNAVTSILTKWVHAVTYPAFKLQATGWTTKQPLPLEGELGSVFCANVFGHYYLTAELMPLLGRGRGRIIWTSSLEAYPWTFSTADIQALKATHSYESTRRLTDVLALTSGLPATAPYADKFFGAGKGEKGWTRPKTYLTHPGVCATAIVPLNVVLWWCMVAAFYVARWLGSPWHTISSYSGARAAVWLALAGEEELAEKKAEKVKWGSSVVTGGVESVKATEVEGEGGVEWEELGRECWRLMEELREEWKGKLKQVGR